MNNTPKKTVLIMFGGKSNEYEISLRSTFAVLTHLNRDKYDVLTLGITREGKWLLYGGDYARIADGSWDSDEAHLTPAMLCPDYGSKLLYVLAAEGMRTRTVDVILPVMHGQLCEDGRLQGLLELCGIPFVGCGCYSAALCMDKDATKTLVSEAGIPVAKWVMVRREELSRMEDVCARLEREIGYPIFIKPANSGSSVGCSKATDRASLVTALETSATVDKKIMAEEFIRAREVEVAVLDGATLTVSSTGEIDSGSVFYDYDAKYKNDTARYYIPARIGDTEERVRLYAAQIFRLLDARGLSRVDFFVTDEGRIYFNEINTLPGFTSISMYPKLMGEAGIPFDVLLDRLLEDAEVLPV